ncbi:MAG: hypothetical protein ACKV2Q_12305 [Planctomycetaceae bacterium]
MTQYRCLFAAAAVFNFVIGIWSGIAPNSFFGLFEAPVPEVLVPWGVVASLIGACGVLYLIAAWRPERADWLIAIGLATKLLGPGGWLVGVAVGIHSPRLFPFVVFGDLWWSFAFGWYLMRRYPHREMVIVWLSAAFHLAACLGLLVVGQGTEMQPDPMKRQAWVLSHTGMWVVVWMVWALSSLSLPWLITTWVRSLWPNAHKTARCVMTASLAIIIVGVLCDLCGESLEAAWLTRSELSVDQFLKGTRWYQLVSPLAANGLYCIGGLAISVVGWRIRSDQRGLWGASGILMWLIGLGLSLATAFAHEPLMVATGAGVMVFFLPWAMWLGWKLRSQP